MFSVIASPRFGYLAENLIILFPSSDSAELPCSFLRFRLIPFLVVQKTRCAIHACRYVWFPIDDFGVTSPADTALLVEELARMVHDGHILYMHCLSGRGRTGAFATHECRTQNGIRRLAFLEFILRNYFVQFHMIQSHNCYDPFTRLVLLTFLD